MRFNQRLGNALCLFLRACRGQNQTFICHLLQFLVSTAGLQAHCAAPAELVVYDRDNDNVWNTGDTAINPVSGTTPSYGAQLSLDPKIKYWDANGDNIWSPGEVVLYDTNNNNVYESGEPVIAGSAPPNSTPLKSDPLVKFVDTNINGGWNDLIPAPVMSDNGSNEGCVHRQYGLSNNKDWIIVLYASNLAGSFGCLP